MKVAPNQVVCLSEDGFRSVYLTVFHLIEQCFLTKMKCAKVKFSVIKESLERGSGHANAETYFAQLAELAPDLYHSLDMQGGELLVQLSDEKDKTDTSFF